MLPTTLKPASITIDAETIRKFAEITGDFNPIHLDEDFARTTSMNGIIAHGTLSSNLLWLSFEETFPTDYDARFEIEIRYLKAVRLGAVMTAGGELASREPLRYAVWVRNEHNEVMISGNLLVDRKKTDALHDHGPNS